MQHNEQDDHHQDITRDEVVRRIDLLHDLDILSTTQRLGMVYLLAFADLDGKVEVSPGEFAQWLRKAPRTAQRTLKDLADSGMIRHLGIEHDKLGRFSRSTYQLLVGGS